jgi:hypothetical protein
MAVSAALATYLALRLSGALWLGLLAGLLLAALFPRLYQYHLLLTPLVGLLMSWRYAERPTRTRLGALGLATAAGLLLRHDQGVYLAAIGLATIAVVHWSAGPRVALRRAGLYACCGLAPIVPFLLFVQLNRGLPEYLQSASEYVRSEAERGRLPAPPAFRIDWSAPLIARREASPAPVGVRWSRALDPESRLELEQRFSLTQGEPEDDDPTSRRWQYNLRDTSPANLAALVADPRVQDTAGIDRETGRLKRPSTEPGGPWWARGPLDRASGLLPGVLHAGNAVVWLFYLFSLIPVGAALVLLARPSVRRGPAAAVVISLLAVCLISQRALLREPLPDRLPDAAAPALVLGAWLAAQLTRPGLADRTRSPGAPGWWRSSTAHPARAVAVGLILTLTALSAVSIGWAGLQSALAGLRDQAAHGPWQLGASLSRLRTNPPIEAPIGLVRSRLVLARYVRACSKPSDRLLVTWFAPELYFYAERGFAAGQIFWFQRVYASPRDQQEMLDRLGRQSVPIVIDWTGREHSAHRFVQVDSYLREHYLLARESTFTDAGRGDVYRVLVDGRATPSSTYEPLSLPCYA